MQCPRCGFEQPDGDECISCGIVIEKYLATVGEAAAAERDVTAGREAAPPERDPVELPAEGFALPGEDLELAEEPSSLPGAPSESAPEAAAAPPPAGTTPLDASESPASAGRPAVAPGAPAVPNRPGLFRRDSRADLPIGKVAAAVRAVASVTCLGIAVLMVVNGSGLISWWPYAVMVFYAAAAIWGLTTVRSEVTLQQFAVEMTVLVLVTLSLRAAAPTLFSVETEPHRAPATVVQPRLPDTPLGRFVGETAAFLRAGDTLLEADQPLPRERWDELVATLDYEGLEGLHGRMGTEGQARVYDLWRRITRFGQLLADMPERYAEETEEGVVLAAPEAERTAIATELDEALLRAERLRARVMVYGAEAP